MKKMSVLFILGSIPFIGIGCSEETEITSLEETYQQNVVKHVREHVREESVNCNPKPIKNQLIVKYKRSTSRYSKEIIRAKYGVISVKTCDCADLTLELWDFGYDKEGNPIGVEQKKAVAESDPDLEGTDNNFVMRTTGTASYYTNGTPASNVFSSTGALLSNNSGISIAILDTGLQLDFSDGNNSYLYNSVANNSACSDGNNQEVSGWDFVNEDNIPSDDNGHGTIVTGIIAKALKQLNVPYNILPVKIFNHEGLGSYFDLLCGYRFAAKKPGVDIINMSFGWCSESNTYTLLEHFIGETEEKGKIVIVTSAGNEGSNNDQLPHYPSSYTNTNLLSITAINNKLDALASFSNYGYQSVDFAAIGENIFFDFGNEPAQVVSGTSFATANASAYVACLYSEGVTVGDIESVMKNKTTYLNTLQNIKNSSYISN